MSAAHRDRLTALSVPRGSLARADQTSLLGAPPFAPPGRTAARRPDLARRRAKRSPPLFARLRRLVCRSSLRAPDAGRRAGRLVWANRTPGAKAAMRSAACRRRERKCRRQRGWGSRWSHTRICRRRWLSVPLLSRRPRHRRWPGSCGRRSPTRPCRARNECSGTAPQRRGSRAVQLPGSRATLLTLHVSLRSRMTDNGHPGG
jgi:hypothetical protein